MKQGRLSEDEVRRQSEAAFSQSGEKWKRHARLNGEIFKRNGKSFKELYMTGYGRILVVVGMGKSLEDQMGLLKKYQSHPNTDIVCCDKAFAPLIENGIKPKYVFLADANIKPELWLEQAEDKTTDVTLIASVCCNPEWTRRWKGPIYFYVNKDNIKTEKIYSEISGCYDLIPASSNVGNTAVVFSTSILQYKEYLLVGYDFAWEPESNYYAFHDNDKRYWMKTHHIRDNNGEPAYTSSNLLFSCRWLQDYYTGPVLHEGMKMFNCSGRGFLKIPEHDLDKRIEKFIPEQPNRNTELKRKAGIAKVEMITKDNGGANKLLDILKNNDVISAQIQYCEKDKSEVVFV